MNNAVRSFAAAALLSIAALSNAGGVPDEAPSASVRTASEWTRVDWEVAQRVSRMTASEIGPMTERARKGDLHAQTLLGIAWREGIERVSVGKASGAGSLRYGGDNLKAVEWLRLAADAGYPMAQVELGEMYYQGHGVDRDLAQAIAWTAKAARHDYPRAKMNLAQFEAVRTPGEQGMQRMFTSVIDANMRLIEAALRDAR